MRNNQLVIQTYSSIGDSAVDGLFYGVAAGAVMVVYLAAIGVLLGNTPASTLSAFDLGEGSLPIRGALIHLALATIYGMMFSLGRHVIGYGKLNRRSYSLISGLVYGLLLWLMTQIAFAGGLNVPLSSLPIVHFAAAHALYGLTLGWLIGRPKLL